MWKFRVQVRKLRVNGLLDLRTDGKLDPFMLRHFDELWCSGQVDGRILFGKVRGYNFDVTAESEPA